MQKSSALNKHLVPKRLGGDGAARWTRDALARLGDLSPYETAPICAEAALPMSPNLDVWDAWPVADIEGRPITWNDGELWFALAVDRSDNPESRHLLARIHHFHRTDAGFVHLGRSLPDELSPAVCEWSGSALHEDGQVTLFFTATGNTADPQGSYHQRLFSTSAHLNHSKVFASWSIPAEIVKADGKYYRPASQQGGEPGKIKAFRDPSFFRDVDSQDYLLFTGSSAAEPSDHDGVVGLAIANRAHDYVPLPPLIAAPGVNNELERPHIVRHRDRLYLFWSTQRGVFAPGIAAPSGLYGATAHSLDGPWEFLNGHGLVLCNPAASPTQAYSWWVLPDLTVASFVDYWGPEDASRPEIETRRERFGGTFAPFVQIALDGTASRLVETP